MPLSSAADRGRMKAARARSTRRRACGVGCGLLILATAAFAPATPAGATTFGPALEASTDNYPVRCGEVGGLEGCTAEDVLIGDTETLLPEPITNGDQEGVITTVHVKSAVEEPAMFVIVEWSGRPGAGESFPSGVKAISEPVVLHPGISNFNTNLPVDRRFASNGFESWSQLAITILSGNGYIPAESGGSFAYTGTIWDSGRALTQTVEDLTVFPHGATVGGLPPATLLISGEITNTTKPNTEAAPEPTPGPQPEPKPVPPQAPVPELTIPAFARVKGNRATLPLKCVGAANCVGRLILQNVIAPSATVASRRKKPKTITYGKASFSISAGRTRSVVVKLSKAGRIALKRHRSLTVWVNANLTGSQPKSWKLTLRR
jgi:hypothetical protein